MFKSKLQELCQQFSVPRPDYTTARDGPVHNAQFSATVTVNGLQFQSSPCRSSKEAQNLAARFAFEYFTANPPQFLTPKLFPGHSLTAPSDPALAHDTTSRKFYVSQTSPAQAQIHLAPDPAFLSPQNGQYIYKNRLQQYAQKQGITFPEYCCEIDGPPNQRQFRPKVVFAGNIFESQQYFSTVKEAEQAAAKIALEALAPSEIQGGALYKTLLQQLAIKLGFLFPVYKTIQTGPPHAACFLASVVVGEETYQGQAAKSKKLAETNAAEVAYNSLIKCADISSKRQKTSNTPGTHTGSINRS